MKKSIRELYENLQYWWWGNSIWVSDLLTIILPVLFFAFIAFCMNACGTVKEIPVETIEKIEYRDSLIFIHDTILVEVPQEKVVQVLPDIDTSYLKTSIAESIAYIDTTKMQLHHTLEQKGTLEVRYDTIVKVEYVDRIITKDVPIIQEIEVPRYDTFFWILFGWTMFTILIIILRLCIKSETLLR